MENEFLFPPQNELMVAVQRAQFFAQISLQSLQHFQVSFRIETAHTRPIPGKTHLRPACRWQQHQADVDELILHRVGRVAKHEEAARDFRSHHCTPDFFAADFSMAAALHPGKGWRDELRKAKISSRTLPRRSTIVCTSLSSGRPSLTAHSGGMAPAISSMIDGSRFSTRPSQGSNDSHPRTSG